MNIYLTGNKPIT